MSVLSHVTKLPSLTTPVLADKYGIYDLILSIAGDFFKYENQGVEVDHYGYICNDGMEYLDCILEKEDTHLRPQLEKEILSIAREILKDPQFDYLKDSGLIIDEVQYRYDQSDKYVRWYITLY